MKFDKLTDDAIVAIIDGCVSNSNNAWNSNLSVEREEAYKFYIGEYPRPSATSKFVSRDVYEGVEGLKAALLETFSTGRRIVQFSPTGADDVEHARIATEYCSYVIFRQNDGFKIFQDVIHDGLMARVGITKYWWQKKIERIPYAVENFSQNQLDMALADDEVEIDMNELTAVTDPITGEVFYEGTITRLLDASHIAIAVIPPEEFLISPYATSIENAKYVIHQTEMSISELLEMGYKKEDIENIGVESSLNMSSEVQTRWMDVDNNIGEEGDYQEQTRNVLTHEVYIHLDVDGKGTTKLWRIFKVGNKILDKEEVNEKPFIAFVPLPVPHRFYGEAYTDLLIPIQNAKTTLTRGILDHTVMTNTPRYKVLNGTLVNPRELMESRVGGIVNVTDMDGVRPLEQSSLNPFVFQVLGALDQSKEDVTGVSKFSQGLNKDAISKQNSAAMVESLVTLSQQRQKVIARNFGECFLKALYCAVNRLASVKETSTTFQEITGNFVQVDPSKFYARKNLIVDLALGYGEREREAQKWISLNDYMSKPENSVLYSLMHKYNAIRRAVAMMDIADGENFLQHPDQIPPPQPDPVMVANLENAKAQLEINKSQTELGWFKARTDAERERQELALKAQDTGAKIAMEAQRQKLEEERFELKARLDRLEAEMLQKTPTEAVNSIVSLN